jgi:hypothetical protein
MAVRKEDIEKIRRIVDEDNRKQRVVDSGLSERKSSAEIANEKGRVAAIKLRKTGVVELMETIRDEGILRMSDKPCVRFEEVNGLFGKRNRRVKCDFEPASVWENGYGMVTIQFDGYSRMVTARMDGESLVISGEEKVVISDNLNIAEVLGKAILNPENINMDMRDN